MNGGATVLRLLLGLVITGASILIGCNLSSRLSRRRAILGDYLTLLDEAANRMRYTASSLAAVFADNFAGFSFDPVIAFAPQWERMADAYRDVLNDGDRQILISFARELGQGDVPAELDRFRLYEGLLKERFDDAAAACEKKGSLYRLLPFSIGLAITILLL